MSPGVISNVPSAAFMVFAAEVERFCLLHITDNFSASPTYTKYSAGTAILGVSVVELVALLDVAIVIVLLFLCT